MEREECPETSSTAEGRSSKSSASNSAAARFARPSSGGAATASLRRPFQLPRAPDDEWLFDPDSPERDHGWIDFRLFPKMAVVQGAGVGGGSLIYANIFVPAERDNWVVIMAGGLGTRLKELTQSVPKPMLSVGDRPLLETAAREASRWFEATAPPPSAGATAHGERTQNARPAPTDERTVTSVSTGGRRAAPAAAPRRPSAARPAPTGDDGIPSTRE